MKFPASGSARLNEQTDWRGKRHFGHLRLDPLTPTSHYSTSMTRAFKSPGNKYMQFEGESKSVKKEIVHSTQTQVSHP